MLLRLARVLVAALLAVALFGIACSDPFDDLPWDTYSDQADSIADAGDQGSLRTPDTTPNHSLGLAEPLFVIGAPSHVPGALARRVTGTMPLLDVPAMWHAPPSGLDRMSTSSGRFTSASQVPLRL
jgi:hypothetical protein